MIVLHGGAARNVAEESRSSICYHIGKWPTASDVPNFGVRYVSDIWNSKNLAEGPHVKCIDACTEKLRCGQNSATQYSVILLTHEQTPGKISS